MKLTTIIGEIKAELKAGRMDVPVNSIQYDSRKVSEGDVFVAIPGTVTDGHLYIDQAANNGARAIVCEHAPDNLPGKDVTFLIVNDSNTALGEMAANYYGHPSKGLKLIGVTGTNGKTTIATFLYKLFRGLGYGTGLLSTIQNRVMGDESGSTHTTPDALEINRILRELCDRGGEYCFMEVSSHAIDQKRIAGLHFAGGIFTNITHDHLDYHKTFQDYLLAKQKFFDALPTDAFALTNLDDRNGMVMVQNTRAKVSTYALKKPADFNCRVLEIDFQGLQLIIDEIEVYCRITGVFNAYNLLAVYGAAVLLGQDRRNVLTALSSMEPAEGRFHAVQSENNITGIIDYAHTPDALKNVLETISAIRTRNEKLITVVGAGGDRDRSKRPLMGQICAEYSDVLILTSDNPRSEDPELIIEEMKAGVPAEHSRKVLSITSRKEAIKTAFQLAGQGDIILVAGKGHEKYQEIKGVKHAFDDREILEGLMNLRTIDK